MDIILDESVILEKINKVFFENGIFSNEVSKDEYLDLDSLTQVSLLVCFENELNFVFSDESLINLPQTYEGLVQLVFNNIKCSLAGNEENTLLPCEGGDINEEKTQKTLHR